MSIEIIDGAHDRDVADWLAERLVIALDRARGGEIAMTVPGGSTPFAAMAELARANLDWPRVTVWPGDDRIVDEADPASNVGRIRGLLGPTGATIVPLSEESVPPHFALAWLGMGADGHVASLFPNTDPRVDDLRPVRRITPDPLPPEAPFDRLSLTLPALLSSDALVFVMRGAEKRRLFEAAMVGANDLPVARLLAARRQSVTCFV